MTLNNDQISFGKYLENLRLEKEVHLEEISAATKISMHVLSHIEKEDHAQLPSPAVVRGFLRLYSDCVGGDKNMVVNLYTINLEANTVTASARGLMGKQLNFWFRLFLSFGFLAGIVMASVYFISEPIVHDQVIAPKSSESSTDVSVETADIEMIETVEPLSNESEIVPQKHKLLIQAVDETWIKLIIDGKSPDEYTLASGDRLELEALKSFNILIGNASGVNLTLDEKPVRVSGKNGQVLTLKLP
jgi:cytoskeleton protein RodZ